MRELLLPPTTQEVKAVWEKKRTIYAKNRVCVCVAGTWVLPGWL